MYIGKKLLHIRYVNEYGCLECCNCEPISESDYDHESDSSSGDDPTSVLESESDSV